MSYLVIAWSMCGAMSLMLGFMHMMFWFSNRRVFAYLLVAIMGFSAAVNAILELQMLMTHSPEFYSVLVLWSNLAIFLILIPMVWFVQQYFQTGRRWLAIVITLMWSAGILVNFLLPGNLTFYQVTELNYTLTFWGESFSLPVGELNPWRILADASSFLILVYTVDASIQLWRQAHRNRAWIVGGAIVVFIVLAGIHTPLVDAGLVKTPYLISFSFLAIVFALSFQVVRDAVKGAHYAQELNETRRNLEQVVRANLLGEYATTLAHELNQPLAAILSNAQAARRYLSSDVSDPGLIREILNDIVRDDKRASEIINWLRGMLKKQDVAREYFDLNDAIKEVVSMLNGDLKQKNIRISARYDKDIPPLYAGRIEVQQLILNLLTNASRAINGLPGRRRMISIRTHLVEEVAQVDITDSGPGIPPELVDTLFDAFVSGNKDGLGMGLALCRRIIEAYGGRIWAGNAKTGGAIFTFTLPINVAIGNGTE